MHLGSIDFSYIAWDDFVAVLGWLLLAGPAAVWFAGQLGFLPRGRNIGIYTPVLTAFLGVMILSQERRWPF
jgi:hypothetical protein